MASSRLRTALRDFASDARAAAAQLDDSLATLKRSIEHGTSVGTHEFKDALADLEEEVAGIARELQLLERQSTDGLSLQELLGHSVGVYEANRQGVLRLQEHLQRYGQVLPLALQQPSNPFDPLASPGAHSAGGDMSLPDGDDDMLDDQGWQRTATGTAIKAPAAVAGVGAEAAGVGSRPWGGASARVAPSTPHYAMSQEAKTRLAGRVKTPGISLVQLRTMGLDGDEDEDEDREDDERDQGLQGLATQSGVGGATCAPAMPPGPGAAPPGGPSVTPGAGTRRQPLTAHHGRQRGRLGKEEYDDDVEENDEALLMNMSPSFAALQAKYTTSAAQAGAAHGAVAGDHVPASMANSSLEPAALPTHTPSAGSLLPADTPNKAAAPIAPVAEEDTCMLYAALIKCKELPASLAAASSGNKGAAALAGISKVAALPVLLPLSGLGTVPAPSIHTAAPAGTAVPACPAPAAAHAATAPSQSAAAATPASQQQQRLRARALSPSPMRGARRVTGNPGAQLLGEEGLLLAGTPALPLTPRSRSVPRASSGSAALEAQWAALQQQWEASGQAALTPRRRAAAQQQEQAAAEATIAAEPQAVWPAATSGRLVATAAPALDLSGRGASGSVGSGTGCSGVWLLGGSAGLELGDLGGSLGGSSGSVGAGTVGRGSAMACVLGGVDAMLLMSSQADRDRQQRDRQRERLQQLVLGSPLTSGQHMPPSAATEVQGAGNVLAMALGPSSPPDMGSLLNRAHRDRMAMKQRATPGSTAAGSGSSRPGVRPVTASEFASLPAFLRSQTSAQQLNAALALAASLASGAVPGAGVVELGALEGQLEGGCSAQQCKVVVNSLVKLGRACLQSGTRFQLLEDGL